MRRTQKFRLHHFILAITCSWLFTSLSGQKAATGSVDLFPVRGLCIAAPSPERLDDFLEFISEELAPRNVNTLILRVDYGYRYKSHPELIDGNGLSEKEVKKLVKACRTHSIDLVPQINLLGHQSWANRTGALLRVYPEFDETPHIGMPEKYEWPNADGLYCKSYCPLHPGVHDVVFDLVDEICDVFEATAFHAGMDEVFYIAHDSCTRCAGEDPAELFAGEVTAIRDHLAEKERRLWIWGDRLIDGETTGMGMWEASTNGTHPAIDLIPRDVMICDWHYERPDQTAVYFAMKGFDVVTCPFRRPGVAVEQVGDMARFRANSSKDMSDRFQGIVQTVWSSAGSFLDDFGNPESRESENSPVACFIHTFETINNPDR